MGGNLGVEFKGGGGYKTKASWVVYGNAAMQRVRIGLDTNASYFSDLVGILGSEGGRKPVGKFLGIMMRS